MIELYAYAAVAVFVLALVAFSVKILREYERAVVFLLGRFWKVNGPGLIIIVPLIQQIVRVDLRIVVLDVPTQDVISRDNVSVQVNAVVYYRVIDAQRAIIQVENFHVATSQLAQTTLRSVLGQHELDEMLAERDKLNTDIQRILDERTDAWGIKVSNVELKQVDVNETMVRAIAKPLVGMVVRPRAATASLAVNVLAISDAARGRMGRRDRFPAVCGLAASGAVPGRNLDRTT